jgi:hypothetical protein
MANHVNQYNGIAYKDDPALLRMNIISIMVVFPPGRNGVVFPVPPFLQMQP